jgi:hypothetical protein
LGCFDFTGQLASEPACSAQHDIPEITCPINIAMPAQLASQIAGQLESFPAAAQRSFHLKWTAALIQEDL